MTPRFAIEEIALFERPVRFTKPFRFGAVTVDAAPQAFVRVIIDVEGFGRAQGATAEMMMPKWFDKNPALSPMQTIDELRRSLVLARDAYLQGARDTAFGHHVSRVASHRHVCARENIPALAAAFGPAEIDKAVLDALLRAIGLDVFAGLRRNVMGLDARLTPDLSDNMIEAFLATRERQDRVAVRYTVGLVDPVGGPSCVIAAALQDGLHFFKIKLGGDVDADCMRLATIAQAFGDADCRCTVDANEQYFEPAALVALTRALATDARLAGVASRLLYIEQPLPREKTWDFPLADIAGRVPFIIDEADDSFDAFPHARALGYRGVSSKSCKGLYKSLLNGARATHWNRDEDASFFITAEDLTCQAGLAVQQDTALAAFLGLTHAERNGHIYGDGFGTASAHETHAFVAAHPAWYERRNGCARLRIADGALDTTTLVTPGFASRTEPDWNDMQPLRAPQPEDCHAH